jgi:hypothetical protein
MVMGAASLNAALQNSKSELNAGETVPLAPCF